MNTSTSVGLAAVLSTVTGTLAVAIVAAVATAVTSSQALAHGGTVAAPVEATSAAVIYTNAAYTRAIPGAENPAPETVSPDSRVLYVDSANGPAIYSYPGRSAR